jgi:hypothetical protein
MSERNQNVSNNPNGTLLDRETITDNLSQNLLSTEMKPPIHVGLSDYSDATGISLNGDYIQCPLRLPSHYLAMEKQLFHKDKILYRPLVS